MKIQIYNDNEAHSPFYLQAESEVQGECLCGGVAGLVTRLDRAAALLCSSSRKGRITDPLALCAAFEKPKDVSVKIKAAVLWCQKWVLPLCVKGNPNCKK